MVCLLGCASSLLGCANTEPAPAESTPDAPGLTPPSSVTTTPASTPMGTQTGGEGGQPYCGEGPPSWVPVAETIPFPGRYAGRIELEGGDSVLAELSLSNLGTVYALELDPTETVNESCATGRQGELDWQLHVDGVLSAAQHERVVYAAGYRGRLGQTFELAEVGMQLQPPSVEEFRAANGPAPWAPGDGPVRVEIALHLGDATAELELRWSCTSCDSAREALPLATGTLVTGGNETRQDTPNY